MASTINGTSTGNGGLISTGDDSGILNIQTNETTAITVDASQNVGIGTATPTSPLEIKNSTVGQVLTLTSVASNIYGVASDGTISSYTGGILTGTGGFVGTSSAHPYIFRTSNTERMRIASGGTISYGTSNAPSNALFRGYGNASAIFDFGPQTSGSAFVVFNTGGAGVYVTSGNTSWTGVSDERLKTDLKPIENALNKVNQLRSVTGRFKTDAEGTSRSFLIAQDVQAVLPEAVDATDPEKLGVQYTEVIPLLVAAIKELKAINDTQAETINALTARIVALEGA
jgi:hypothetical protein